MTTNPSIILETRVFPANICVPLAEKPGEQVWVIAERLLGEALDPCEYVISTYPWGVW